MQRVYFLAMALRSGVYIVPTHRWYIERTVWLISGFVLLASTALALLANPLWILGVTATGLVSINVAFTGFCPVGSILRRIGFTPMLGDERAMRGNWYFLQTDRWYLERRIYLFVGINITIASILFLAWSPWWSLFTLFVGSAMVWFAATGYCIMANMLYWLGAEPRLNPQILPAARGANGAKSPDSVSGNIKRA
jgi:Inner membrane protein YgaP-like, transmembrane domain